MMKNKKQKLIPKLRFPEFKNEENWTIKRLADFDNLPSGDGDWILSKDISSNGSYKIVQLSSIGFGSFKEKVLKTISEETFLELNGTPIEKGDLLINRMVDANKINCCIFPYEGKYVTSVDVCWIRQNPYINNYFLMSLLSTGDNQTKLLSLSSGAGRVRISKSNLFENFFFPLPKNQKEEQKIASCLSTLDEVITAHSRKLNLLKDHKKALMQNLFPQKGQKVPNFRFPEFKNNGDWVKKKLGDKDVAFIVNEKIPIETLNVSTYISTENMLAEFNGVSMASNLPLFGNFTKFKNDDILISNIRPYLKKVWKANKIGGASNDVIVFRAKEKVISEFLEFILKNEVFINYVMESAKGVKMPRGDKDSMLQYPIFIPSKKEQQKIASCLSTVDELITVQKAKIKQLKIHKKGVMQGLFPKMSE